MKSILSKRMKYPKGRGRMETTGSSATGIHEISTQTIMQTSALLHATHDAAVITPTSSSNSNNVEAFRPIRSPNVVVDDVDDDDTASSNGASVSDDHDSDVVVLVENENDDDDDHPPADRGSPIRSWTNAVIGDDCRVRVSSPLGEPKEVRFQTDHPPHPEEFRDEAESFVLHEQLRNVLQDLSAEKAMRFQKEKSLVKLAKQLKKRNQEIQVYDAKILKMAQFINSLQLELQQVRDYDRVLRPPPETERTTEVASLQDTIQTLRTELQESQQQRQMVFPKTTLPEPAAPLNIIIETGVDASSATTTRGRRSFRWTFGSLLAVMVAVATFDQYLGGITTQNFLCAPIRPGTILVPTLTPQVYEAPWWVPSRGGPLKAILHTTFCPHTPRTSVHWSGDKLVIHQLGDRAVLVHGRGPAGVQFRMTHPESMGGGEDRSRRRHVIQLLRTNRAGITLPAPWLSS